MVDTMSNGSMRALVVDDFQTIHQIMRRVLGALGIHDISDAVDGEKALEVLEKEGPFNLVLVDWYMPVMNGLDFVRAVRARRHHDSTKILMVTTEAEQESIVAALDAGADDYLMKPFTPEMVEEKLAILGLCPAKG